MNRQIHFDQRIYKEYLFSDGYVYLARLIDFPIYKIGVTTNTPKERIRQLRSDSPFDVELICFCESNEIYWVEFEFHKDFKDCWMRGEWFELNPERLNQLLEKFQSPPIRPKRKYKYIIPMKVEVSEEYLKSCSKYESFPQSPSNLQRVP